MAENPRRSRNSTRDRENAERAALRRLVDQLNAQLETLQHGQRPSIDVSRMRERPSGRWLRLAEGQARARSAAERTNATLNERLQANADWIQRLWELLREKRQRIEPSLRCSQYEDAMVFARLKQDVRLASMQSHQAFAANHIHLPDIFASPLKMEDRWSHVKTPGFGSRLACLRYLPFDAPATTRAMWSALSGSESNSKPDYGELPVCIVDRSPDECALKYQAQIHLREDLTALEYHAVSQQIPGCEAYGQTFFVWHSVWTDAQGRAEHTCNSWIAVTNCPLGLGSVVAIVSQSQVREVSENAVAALQTAVMPSVESCIDHVLISLENTLFGEEQSLRSVKRDDSNKAATHSARV